MWRDWKRRLKADHFTRYIGDVDHDFSELSNEQVELDQWLVLVQYWKHDEVQKQAVQNAESRAKKKYPHRTGKTPFPLLKEKMQQEGKDTTQLDMFIESRSCGKGIEADPATANLIQEFREGLSKRPESEQTKEFKEDLFVNGLGEDPHGRVRCMGRGITRHKLCEISSHNAPTPQMVEQLQELQRLKDDLIHEKKEVELMRLELDNRKEEFFKKKKKQLIRLFAINADNRRNDNGYNCSPVQVGSNVILFCSEIPKEIVAEGTLLSIDPNEKIDEVALGYEFVKVVIRKAIKPDYLLLRPRRGVNTVQDAVGKSVAWEYIDVMEN
ncbi:UNVERIFIED_CONTAM: hypothetical protein Slati_2258700 [Sesamum latifolium]|uniref:Transposase Tnp1/En/Spm-like domain-containing protein n=1 Tax=Sesamum latifolium TaxID=2727402 RepID=A0AAW2WUT2_9LAMI